MYDKRAPTTYFYLKGGPWDGLNLRLSLGVGSTLSFKIGEWFGYYDNAGWWHNAK